jgi:hypothetical protein
MSFFYPTTKFPSVSGNREARGLVLKPRRTGGFLFGGDNAMEKETKEQEKRLVASGGNVDHPGGDCGGHRPGGGPGLSSGQSPGTEAETGSGMGADPGEERTRLMLTLQLKLGLLEENSDLEAILWYVDTVLMAAGKFDPDVADLDID